MSRYQGKLYVIGSEVDGHKIDEVEQLRGAVDHLSRYLAKVVDEGSFDPGWPTQDIAERISNLCEMIKHRERERAKLEPEHGEDQHGTPAA